MNRITQNLLVAAKIGNFTFCTESKDIPGKWAFFFDYDQTGTLNSGGCRSAALYSYPNGTHESNQFGPEVHESYRNRLLSRDF